jgi:hypothetical protein
VAKKLRGSEPNFRQLLLQYQRRSRKKGREFNLTPERFRELTKQNCFICGKRPSAVYRHSLKRPTYRVGYRYNGIDRLANGAGYVEGNVAACCWECNAAKGDKSLTEFLLFIYRAYNHSIKDAVNANARSNEDAE